MQDKSSNMSHIYLMDFWSRTKQRIKEIGCTQDSVAKTIGVSIRTFRGWLTRETMPNADQVLLIARALKVNPEWLVFGTEHKSGLQSIELPTTLHHQVAAKLSGLNESQLKIINLMIDEWKK